MDFTKGVRLRSVPLGINEVKIQPWLAGIAKKAGVSRGVQVEIDLPILSAADSELIYQKGITGFILRVGKVAGAGSSTLGYLYVPILEMKKGRSSSQYASQFKSVFVEILYSAAYPSMRFSKSDCPQLGHAKKIVSSKIKGKLKKIDLVNLADKLLNGKFTKVAMKPFSVNSGKSLLGTYVFDLAFYNLRDKRLKSDFTRLPQEVLVSNEKELSLKCRSKQLGPIKSGNPMRSFRFGN